MVVCFSVDFFHFQTSFRCFCHLSQVTLWGQVVVHCPQQPPASRKSERLATLAQRARKRVTLRRRLPSGVGVALPRPRPFFALCALFLARAFPFTLLCGNRLTVPHCKRCGAFSGALLSAKLVGKTRGGGFTVCTPLHAPQRSARGSCSVSPSTARPYCRLAPRLCSK